MSNTAHSKAAKEFLKNQKYAQWHDQTFWSVRTKRDNMAYGLSEWEQLRETAEVGFQLVVLLIASFGAVAFHHPAGKKSQRDEQHGEREFAWVVAQHKIDCRGTKNQHVGG